MTLSDLAAFQGHDNIVSGKSRGSCGRLGKSRGNSCNGIWPLTYRVGQIKRGILSFLLVTLNASLKLTAIWVNINYVKQQVTR